MLLVLGIIAAMGALMAAGAFYLKAGKVRSMDRLEGEVGAEMKNRLQSIAADVNGTLVSGPALETPSGRLMLVASQAPKILVIDLAKFTAPLKTSQLLTVVGAADAKKVIQNRNLHPVKPDDPEIGKAYAIFSSDEAFGRKVVTAKVVGKIDALNQAVRGRARIQVAGEKATILMMRGLADPDEIRAFHDGCAALVEALTSSLPGASST